MTYDLVKDGFVVLDYDENISEYLEQTDQKQFDDLYLENSNWRCKIHKMKSGELFDMLLKYERMAFEIYENILNIELIHHYNSEESLSSIIYYDKNSGYHGEHTDYGLFNIVLNDNSDNCMYYKNKEWKLFETKNKMIIMNGDEIEKISKGKLKAVKHKVIKPYGFERYIVTKICYPKNKRDELLKKVNWYNL